jgi:membrane fusion protein, multidrug efflux system
MPKTLAVADAHVVRAPVIAPRSLPAARWWLLATLAASLGLAGCGKPGDAPAGAASSAASAPSSKNTAAAKPPAVLLLAAEDALTLESRPRATGPVITGSLQPERRADLRAEVASTVQQVLKDNGEAVRAGDLLVRLDDSSIRESLLSAEEAVRAATQALEQTERQLQRLRTLQGQGMSSMQALEDAEVRRNAANSELVAARARVATAQQQRRRTEVRAPFAGVVSDRRVSVGDTAQIGRELVKVIDPASLRFEGLVSADRMHELKLGQPVSFRVNGFPDAEFAGTVRRVESSADAATRQVAVLVDFAQRQDTPRVAGLFAEGRIETGSQSQLLLPEGAVQRSGEGDHVWKLAADTLVKTAVKLGERDPRSGGYPVLEGLAAGDRVLRAPGGQLVDGQRFENAPNLAAGSAPVGAGGAGGAAAKGTSATGAPN